MTNRLITAEEAASMLYKKMQELSPAEQAAAIYELQVTLGGFPRDKDKERQIAARLEQERNP